jgi:hypothetical protein
LAVYAVVVWVCMFFWVVRPQYGGELGGSFYEVKLIEICYFCIKISEDIPLRIDWMPKDVVKIK